MSVGSCSPLTNHWLPLLVKNLEPFAEMVGMAETVAAMAEAVTANAMLKRMVEDGFEDVCTLETEVASQLFFLAGRKKKIKDDMQSKLYCARSEKPQSER